jgi:hypothetical protein
VIDQAKLAESLGRLDAGTRALLDLSLRRAIPDDQVAKVLGVDATSIPPRRARGIAELADMMEIPGPAELAALLIAIPDLPEDAWGVPAPEPFAGSVSRVRRAKAFRRVAIAASPLVALGAVMAAVVVASSDHSGSGSGAAGTQRAAGGAGAGAGAAASIVAPDARHGLPSGVRLTLVHPHVARGARHVSRHHRTRRAPDEAVPATLARQPAETVTHTEPVVFHPSPVVHTEPRHVTHHHTPSKPKTPATTPSPAPVQTPSQPVSSPAPSTPTTPAVQINAPQTVQSTPTPTKPTKTTPPQPNITPPHDGDDDDDDDDGGGGCSHRGDDSDSSEQHESWHGSSHHDGNAEEQEQDGGGKSFTPPGLFRKRHGH